MQPWELHRFELGPHLPNGAVRLLHRHHGMNPKRAVALRLVSRETNRLLEIIREGLC